MAAFAGMAEEEQKPGPECPCMSWQHIRIETERMVAQPAARSLRRA
jgi:hypothetical protein